MVWRLDHGGRAPGGRHPEECGDWSRCDGGHEGLYASDMTRGKLGARPQRAVNDDSDLCQTCLSLRLTTGAASDLTLISQTNRTSKYGILSGKPLTDGASCRDEASVMPYVARFNGQHNGQHNAEVASLHVGLHSRQHPLTHASAPRPPCPAGRRVGPSPRHSGCSCDSTRPRVSQARARAIPFYTIAEADPAVSLTEGWNVDLNALCTDQGRHPAVCADQRDSMTVGTARRTNEDGAARYASPFTRL